MPHLKIFLVVQEKLRDMNILKIWKTVFHHENALVLFSTGASDHCGVTVLS
jgi:hypothetical protein